MSNSKDTQEVKNTPAAPIVGAAAADQKKQAYRKTLRVVGPLHITDDILDKLKAQGREPKWVNDKLSRIAHFQQMGYEFVTDSEGKKIKEVVYFNGQHKGLESYLMSISHEDRALLRAEKNKDVDDTEAEINSKAKQAHPDLGGLFKL